MSVEYRVRHVAPTLTVGAARADLLPQRLVEVDVDEELGGGGEEWDRKGAVSSKSVEAFPARASQKHEIYRRGVVEAVAARVVARVGRPVLSQCTPLRLLVGRSLALSELATSQQEELCIVEWGRISLRNAYVQ